MLTLLIETSTERGVVFLFDGDRLIFEGHLPPGIHSSNDLLPVLADGLKLVNVSVKHLGLIGVGVGPGSYTGLRVGAMAAKTLSYANKIPLVGICTLSAFSPKSDQGAPYAVIIDAKMGGAYLQASRGQPLVSALADLPLHLQGISLLVTPASCRLAAKLALLYPHAKWEWEETAPHPQTMLGVARKKFAAKEFSLDGSVELLYMRKAQAEIDKEAKA